MRDGRDGRFALFLPVLQETPQPMTYVPLRFLDISLQRCSLLIVPL